MSYIQKHQRRNQKACRPVSQTRRGFDPGNQFLNIGNQVHVPSAIEEFPVEAVRERRGIRHRREQRAIVLQHPAYFMKREIQVREMLQAVVTNDSVKYFTAEGQAGSIALHKRPARRRWNFDVGANSQHARKRGYIKAAPGTSQVQDPRSRRQISEYFMHGRLTCPENRTAELAGQPGWSSVGAALRSAPGGNRRAVRSGPANSHAGAGPSLCSTMRMS